MEKAEEASKAVLATPSSTQPAWLLAWGQVLGATHMLSLTPTVHPQSQGVTEALLLGLGLLIFVFHYFDFNSLTQ